MSRLPPPRVIEPPFAECPRPRTVAEIFATVFDIGASIPLEEPAFSDWKRLKSEHIERLLDRGGVTAKVLLVPTGSFRSLTMSAILVVGGKACEEAEIDAMLAKATT